MAFTLRDFLRGSLAIGAASISVPVLGQGISLAAAPSDGYDGPFRHGVASFDPTRHR